MSSEVVPRFVTKCQVHITMSDGIVIRLSIPDHVFQGDSQKLNRFMSSKLNIIICL